MTLKQKICNPFDGLTKETANKLEQIADEFAIDFLKWCESKSVFSPSVIHKPTYEKLLEAFKKERNL